MRHRFLGFGFEIRIAQRAVLVARSVVGTAAQVRLFFLHSQDEACVRLVANAWERELDGVVSARGAMKPRLGALCVVAEFLDGICVRLLPSALPNLALGFST